jgi:phosphoribosylpyrophosphate synthetase
MTSTQVKKQLDTYLPLLSTRQQEILLDMVKNILHIDKKEKRVTIEQYNNEIEESVRQVNNKEVLLHDDVLKQSKTWFKRK